jgi:hypothetical protein
MDLVIASGNPAPITDVFRSILVYAIWAEVLGVVVAWLRVRKLDAWRERPVEDGSIRLLSIYVVKVTGLMVAWAIIVSLCVIIGSRL